VYLSSYLTFLRDYTCNSNTLQTTSFQLPKSCKRFSDVNNPCSNPFHNPNQSSFILIYMSTHGSNIPMKAYVHHTIMLIFELVWSITWQHTCTARRCIRFLKFPEFLSPTWNPKPPRMQFNHSVVHDSQSIIHSTSICIQLIHKIIKRIKSTSTHHNLHSFHKHILNHHVHITPNSSNYHQKRILSVDYARKHTYKSPWTTEHPNTSQKH